MTLLADAEVWSSGVGLMDLTAAKLGADWAGLLTQMSWDVSNGTYKRGEILFASLTLQLHMA